MQRLAERRRIGELRDDARGRARVLSDDARRAGARSFLKLATNQLSLSARAFHRILKVARTIADLEGARRLTTAHVAEAVQYRQRSRSV